MKYLVITLVALLGASTNVYAQASASPSCADLPLEKVVAFVNASDTTYNRVMLACDRQLGELSWKAESGQAFSKAHAAAVDLQDWKQMVVRARMRVSIGKPLTVADLIDLIIDTNDSQRR